VKVLITGTNGFLGKFLYHDLVSKDYTVFGTAKQSSQDFLELDILNYIKISKLLKDIKPDIIYHLAGQSYPQKSWVDPKGTLNTNITGSLNLLEAVRHYSPKTRVLMVGSSAAYGTQLTSNPIKENALTKPNSPYGVSKLAQDNLSYLYFKKYGLQIICVRPFFLIGPGKVGDVCSDFAKGIIDIEKQSDKKLNVGNLNVIRDFLDFRDGVNAMRIIIEKGEVGKIYNICGGKGYSLEQIIIKMSKIVGFKFQILQSHQLLRPIDDKVLIGNNEELLKLGWKKNYKINDTLFDIVNFWRHQ